MKENFLDCQTYVVIIQGEVISISKFQELKHTVLGRFIKMPLQTRIGCLMISSQSHWNLFLKEVLKLTFKEVLHPWPILRLFMHFSQNLQHIGDK